MSSLFTRLGAYFVDPPPAPRPDAAPPPVAFAPPRPAASGEAAADERSGPSRVPSFMPPRRDARALAGVVQERSRPAGGPSPEERAVPSAPDRSPVEDGARIAVLGAPAVAVPVAAACAGELRARARATAAVLAVWRAGATVAGEEGERASPGAATTPAARRLAARLAAHGLPATACGRLAWLALDPAPGPAAAQAQRCIELADAPFVLALAGPRPPAFEPLLAALAVAVAVLPGDADPALHELARAGLPARTGLVVAPLPPGPPRWAAMAGLARLRSLPKELP